MNIPWENVSKESSLLRSLLANEGAFTSVKACRNWISSVIDLNSFKVTNTPLQELEKWDFLKNPMRLGHHSGKFFTIEGIRVRSFQGIISEWDQPIINQPDIGILGILAKEFDGIMHFLMQAKMEPGNINKVQLSPTIQATKSNYTRVHAGKTPKYLEEFAIRTNCRVLVDQLQSEQGSYFLKKRNRNIVVEALGNVESHEGFCWLTLGQIKRLLTVDNFVNMDSRTVLSCLPLAKPEWCSIFGPESQTENNLDVFGHQLKGLARDLFFSLFVRENLKHSLEEIIHWFIELKTSCEIEIEKIPLDELRGWEFSDGKICNNEKNQFAVVGVDVHASSREVVCWSQPLLEHFGIGLNGFLVQRFGGVLNFLVRGYLEPGNRDIIEMGPSVVFSGHPEGSKKFKIQQFSDYFEQPSPDRVLYSTIQSEEGGRFKSFQNRYMIVEISDDENLTLPHDYIWMTLGQILEFIRFGYFNIEGRNLIACLSLLNADGEIAEDQIC